MITAERLKEALDYDSETGVFRWLIANSIRVKVGKIAVNKNVHGYIRIGIDSESYLGHNLAWLYVHGCLPSSRLDHVNLNRRDNKISNLRMATHSENLCNHPKNSNNTSGFKGVSFFKQSSKWRAYINKSGRRFELGLFSTPEAAAEAYADAARRIHGDFART